MIAFKHFKVSVVNCNNDYKPSTSTMSWICTLSLLHFMLKTWHGPPHLLGTYPWEGPIPIHLFILRTWIKLLPYAADFYTHPCQWPLHLSMSRTLMFLYAKNLYISMPRASTFMLNHAIWDFYTDPYRWFLGLLVLRTSYSSQVPRQ